MRATRRVFGLFDLLNYAFFVLIGVTMVYPFWYVLMFSVSDPTQAAVSSYYFRPQGFSLVAYRYILEQERIFTGFRNSVFVTVVGTVLNLVFTALTAYPLSRRELVGKRVIFGFIFFTMLFGGGMIPTFLVVRALGLVDKLWALIIPGLISVFNLLVMMKFFAAIPDSLIESAHIDGANDMAIVFRIVLPLSAATLAAIGLFYAVRHWNEFFDAIIYINKPEKTVLQVILRSMFQQEGLGRETNIKLKIATPEHFRMATIIIVMFPILCVYPFLQKHFMKGVLVGAVKG